MKLKKSLIWFSTKRLELVLTSRLVYSLNSSFVSDDVGKHKSYKISSSESVCSEAALINVLHQLLNQ